MRFKVVKEHETRRVFALLFHQCYCCKSMIWLEWYWRRALRDGPFVGLRFYNNACSNCRAKEEQSVP